MRFLYKKLVVFFFKVFYTKIRVAKRDISYKYLFKQFKINNLTVKIYMIRNCRLFTNTLDVAVIKNNFLLKGPSLQIRNNKNAKIEFNSAYYNGTPKFYKKIQGRVFSLLPGLDANFNYFHWFFDSLSKIYFYNKYYKFTKNDYFLVPNIKNEYQKKSLGFFGIKNILNAYETKHFKINKLITTNFTNFNVNPPLEIINYFRNIFLKKNLNKIHNNCIFLNRTGFASTYRDIFNKKEVISYLLKKNFKIIDPSKLNFLSQVKIFNSCKKIIGVHGAAFTNIIFCKKGTKIIELKSVNSKNDLYKNIAKKLNLEFKALFLKKKDVENIKRSWDGQLHLTKKNIKNLISN